MAAAAGYTKYNSASSSSNASSFGCTSLAGQPLAIGDVSIVTVFNVSGTTPSSVGDGTHTYSLVNSAVTASGVSVYKYAVRATSNLSAGYTVTVTYGLSATYQSLIEIGVLGGVASGTGFDSGSSSATGSGATATSSMTPTFTPPGQLEVIFVDTACAHVIARQAGWQDSTNTQVQLNTMNGDVSLTYISDTAAVGGSATTTIGPWSQAITGFIFTNPLKENTSVAGSAAGSKTETIAPSSGDAIFLAVCLNENAGADNLTSVVDSQSFNWILQSSQRVGTTNLIIYLYAKIASGGETTVTATDSASGQRIQTAYFNIGKGWSIKAEKTNSATNTTAQTTGNSGAITPGVAGEAIIAVIAAKNAVQMWSPLGFLPAYVNNETVASGVSTQKVTMHVYFNLTGTAVSTTASVTWTVTTAPWSGLICAFQNARAAAGRLIGQAVNRSGSF